MPSSLTIVLDNTSNGIFYPNQVISGTVEVEIDEEDFKARSLKLNFKGKDFAKIPAGKHTFLGINKFLNLTKFLLEPENDLHRFSKGFHSFPFAVKLPLLIPCSAVGYYGYIRYKLEAIFEIPWSSNLRYILAFTVGRYEDLRYFPELGEPCERELMKTYYTLLFKPTLLKIKVRLPKSGYALGETIPLTVELINNSSTVINFTTITFKRIDKFTSDSNAVKILKTKLLENRYSGVGANDVVMFEVFIPISESLMITNDRYCEKFKISYEIRLRAETGIFKLCPTMYIPITIGVIGFDS